MKPMTNAITEDSTTRIRRRAYRRHQLRRPLASKEKSPAESRVSDQSMRSSVADAFRRIAHAMDAARAQMKTNGFYRSSGHEWTQALTERAAQPVRDQVLEAFRTTLRGVQTATAHAITIRFYQSTGQAWALKLGT